MKTRLNDIFITIGVILLTSQTYAVDMVDKRIMKCSHRLHADSKLLAKVPSFACQDIYHDRIFSHEVRAVMHKLKSSEVNKLKEEYQQAYEDREVILLNSHLTKAEKLDKLKPIYANMLTIEQNILDKIESEIRKREEKDFDEEMKEAKLSFIAKHPTLDIFHSRAEKEKREILEELYQSQNRD